MRAIKKSVLLKTSSGNDVQHSGGVVSITGLPEIRYNELRKIRQIKYRAEVVQVVTIGDVDYIPTANTRYAIEVLDLEAKREGYTGMSRVFGYTTPPVLTTIGSTAALQREYIHGKIIAQLNLASAIINLTAVTVGSGDGITITDTAGYYPANPNSGTSRKGANQIIAKTNSDATGFTQSQIVITTPAVYEFGNGTTLAANAPIIASYTQLLVSGDLEAPVAIDNTYAVAGQKYDAFLVSSLAIAPAHAISDQYALVPQEFAVFVDNGAGTSTTNLAGFKTFRTAMYRLMTSLYRRNPSSVIDFFSKPIMVEGALGAAPATTGTYKLLSDEMWQVTQIGTQTIVAPIISATGLLLDQDLTDTEGAEYVPSILTNDAREFVVGKTSFSAFIEITEGDCTDAGLLMGFRKKAAHAADWNDYTDVAAIGTIATVAGATPNGDLISTNGILNNAATVTTSTAVVPADTVSFTMEVLVAMNGAVTCKANGVSYPVYSTGTTPLVLDAGDIMIPFFRYANISTGDPDAVINQFFAINEANWKL